MDREALAFLVVEAVSKHYGGVRALTDVAISLVPGEVHGLVGANGAGKSTLIRILAGLERPDTGRILIDDREVDLTHSRSAANLGLSFIHQELAIVPSMTVLENIMLGSRKQTWLGMIDWKRVEADVAPVIKQVGLKVPLSRDCGKLSVAENWMVSICRALIHRSRLIVMDEPTASLSTVEAARLFAIIKNLASSGVAVLYVSHRLDEILDLCDQVTVLRDGARVAGFARQDLNRSLLVQAIAGGAIETANEARHKAPQARKVVLAVKRLSRRPLVQDVSFELGQGEVLGLGGLVGAGRSQLLRLIVGAARRHGGEMMLFDRPYAPRSCADAVHAGIGFVPEERRAEGLLLTKSIAFNLGLGNFARFRRHGLVDRRAWHQSAKEMLVRLAIKAPGIHEPVARLSGGNQQKVVIGRWLARRPQILILDEPTRGVDVRARGEIHRLIRELADEGMSVIVVSSEPDELPDLCDRVLVLSEGCIVRELTGKDISRRAIILSSFGHAS